MQLQKVNKKENKKTNIFKKYFMYLSLNVSNEQLYFVLCLLYYIVPGINSNNIKKTFDPNVFIDVLNSNNFEMC